MFSVNMISMKKSCLIILISLLYSCQTSIDDNSSSFERVFAQSYIDIKIELRGCFHHAEEYFSAQKRDDGYLIKSKRTGRSHLISKLKMDSLKAFLKPRIGKDVNGGCSSSQYIRIGLPIDSIEYRHSYCMGTEARTINNLLNYRELIEEEMYYE